MFGVSRFGFVFWFYYRLVEWVFLRFWFFISRSGSVFFGVVGRIKEACIRLVISFLFVLKLGSRSYCVIAIVVVIIGRRKEVGSS